MGGDPAHGRTLSSSTMNIVHFDNFADWLTSISNDDTIDEFSFGCVLACVAKEKKMVAPKRPVPYSTYLTTKS